MTGFGRVHRNIGYTHRRIGGAAQRSCDQSLVKEGVVSSRQYGREVCPPSPPWPPILCTISVGGRCILAAMLGFSRSLCLPLIKFDLTDNDTGIFRLNTFSGNVDVQVLIDRNATARCA